MVAARVPCSRRDPAAGRAGLRGRAPTAPSASRAGAAAVGGRRGSEVVIFIRKRGGLTRVFRPLTGPCTGHTRH